MQDLNNSGVGVFLGTAWLSHPEALYLKIPCHADAISEQEALCLLLHHYNRNPPVFRSVAGRVILDNRLGFTIGKGVHAVQWNSELRVQVTHDSLGSGLAQLHIVFFGPYVVRVPLNLDVDILVFLFHNPSKNIETLLSFIGKTAYVKAEMNRVARDRRLIK